MKSRRTRGFRKALPRRVQKQARTAYRLFRQDASHPGLNFKPVDAEARIYSVRSGRHYRALGVWRGDSIVWFWIGSHAEYDKFISQW